MPLSEGFPTDPYVVLHPAIRWYPGDPQIGDIGREKLIPPLVEKVRVGVKAWRDSGYAGASATTRAARSCGRGRSAAASPRSRS